MSHVSKIGDQTPQAKLFCLSESEEPSFGAIQKKTHRPQLERCPLRDSDNSQVLVRTRLRLSVCRFVSLWAGTVCQRSVGRDTHTSLRDALMMPRGHSDETPAIFKCPLRARGSFPRPYFEYFTGD